MSTKICLSCETEYPIEVLTNLGGGKWRCSTCLENATGPDLEAVANVLAEIESESSGVELARRLTSRKIRKIRKEISSDERLVMIRQAQEKYNKAKYG